MSGDTKSWSHKPSCQHSLSTLDSTQKCQSLVQHLWIVIFLKRQSLRKRKPPPTDYKTGTRGVSLPRGGTSCRDPAFLLGVASEEPHIAVPDHSLWLLKKGRCSFLKAKKSNMPKNKHQLVTKLFQKKLFQMEKPYFVWKPYYSGSLPMNCFYIKSSRLTPCDGEKTPVAENDGKTPAFGDPNIQPLQKIEINLVPLMDPFNPPFFWKANLHHTSLGLQPTKSPNSPKTCAPLRAGGARPLARISCHRLVSTLYLAGWWFFTNPSEKSA